MKRTGIFFTYFLGERLKDFPQALDGILNRDNVSYYDAVYDSRDGLYYLEPLSEELLLKVFRHDSDVLHVCFCHQDYSDEHNNLDVRIPYRTTDEEYLSRVRQEFIPRVMAFEPEYIFWEFGYDATQGEYGDKGLTRDCHPKLARVFKEAADKVCQGRLIAILCGGSGRAVATYTIPRIIACLAELDSYH